MPKIAVPKDKESLKPIIEAMIFASEEPIAPRTLLRILYEDDSPAGRSGGNGVVDEQISFPEHRESIDEIDDEAGPAGEEESSTAPGDLLDAGALADAMNDADAPGAEEPTAEIEAETVSGDVQGEAMDVPDVDRRPEEEPMADGSSARTIEIVEGLGSEGEESIAPAGTAEFVEESDLGSWERIGQRELRQIVDELNDEYDATGRVFRIIEIAGGFQFATTKELGEWVGLLTKDKARRRLSPAALETLAIITYRQPVTKPEVEAIRGVNCDQVILSLLEKNLVAITGRADTVGKPLLYGTTDEFLRAFGLNSLNDLPKLREIEELMEEEAHLPQKLEVVVLESVDQMEQIPGLVEGPVDLEEALARERERGQAFADEDEEGAGIGEDAGENDGENQEAGTEPTDGDGTQAGDEPEMEEEAGDEIDVEESDVTENGTSDDEQHETEGEDVGEEESEAIKDER